MWIEKCKNGYRIIERIKVNGKYRRVSVSFTKDTHRERKRAIEKLERKKAGICTPIEEKPLKSLLEPYMESKTIKETTRESMTSTLYKAMEYIGDISIGSLESRLVKRALADTGKAPKTLNRYVYLLNTFFRWLYEMGYTASPVSVSIFRDPTPKPSPDQLYLEAEELGQVLDQLTGMNKYVCHFLALTGCRIGEACALKLDDITDTHISITKTMSHTGILTTAKTAASERQIYIQDELRTLLDDYKEWRLLFMMSKGIRTDYLFFGRYGERYQHTALERALSRIDMGKRLHPHILRHTHTALLAEQGIPLDVIARRLGHDGTEITRKVYYHVTEKQKRKDDILLQSVKIL